MRLPNFAEWLTIVANLAVVAGIAFLALELRQTNDLMESERRYNRLQVVLDGTSLYIENPSLAEAVLKSRRGEELTESEEFVLDRQLSNIFTIWQWTWIELGATEEFPLASYRTTMRLDYIQSHWKAISPGLMPEFVSFVEENIVPR